MRGVIELIKSIRPLHVTDEDYVFVNSQEAPLDPQILAGKYWHTAISYCQIRQRKPYCMKHTYISLSLSAGRNPQWLSEQVGDSLVTILKHYGQYIPEDNKEAEQRFFGKGEAGFSRTFSRTRKGKTAK